MLAPHKKICAAQALYLPDIRRNVSYNLAARPDNAGTTYVSSTEVGYGKRIDLGLPVVGEQAKPAGLLNEIIATIGRIAVALLVPVVTFIVFYRRLHLPA